MSTLFGVLKCLCVVDETRNVPRICSENYYTRMPRRKMVDLSLLHTSSSSRSSASPLSIPGMDETLMNEVLDGAQGGDNFVTSYDNPEAMFDVLTIQSIRERYSDTDKVSSTEDISAVISDQEFDNFVRDFPIDDSISECFAASPDQIVPVVNVNPKVSNSPTKQNKLKKKLVQRNGNEETILSDEDSRSSDSKRSKLIGNIFGRRNKAKDGYKPLKQTDPSTGNDITDAIIDACEHITKSYKKPKQNGTTNSVTSDKSAKREKAVRSPGSADSNSDKSQKVSSVVSSPSRAPSSVDRFQGYTDKMSLRKLPPVPGPDDLNVIANKGQSSSLMTKQNLQTGNDLFESIEILNDQLLIQKLSKLHENIIRELRDNHGNTILHKCIITNKEETSKALLTKCPDLCLATNKEGDTAMELAIKLGRVACMTSLLEAMSAQRFEDETFIARIVNLAAQIGQTECLTIIIDHVSHDHRFKQSLPVDSDGNTAAHIAAINGRLQCLQLLVERGFNIWNVNKEGHRPMQLAIMNNHTDCFHYLLVLECSQCLVKEAVTNAVKAERLKSQRMNMQASMNQLEQHLSKYYTQFNDALRNMLESRKNILQSADAVYSGTTDVLRNAGVENDDIIRADIENMKAEMERLQDLLEFSPLANSSDILSRMVSAFQEFVISERENNQLENDIEFKHIEVEKQMCSLIQKIQDTPTLCSNTDIQRHVNELVSSLKLTAVIGDSIEGKSPHNKNSSNSNTVVESQVLLSSSSPPNRQLKTRHRKEETRNRNRGSAYNRQKVFPIGDGSQRGRFANVSDADSESTVSELPLLESLSGSESLYTSTMTSGVTCTDMTSEKTSRIGTMSGDSSDSESDWWDDPRHKRRHRSKLNRQSNVFDDNASSNTVRLNLENEDLPDEALRQHRLNQHLKSMHKVNTHRADFVETVITASGKRMGGREQSSKGHVGSNKHLINSLSNGTKATTKEANTKTSNKDKHRSKSTKLFSLQDVVSSREISPSEFMESYDRSRGTPDLRWDEMSLTDVDEARQNEKPWYEMSEDEESIIHTWRSDDDEDQSRDYRDV